MTFAIDGREIRAPFHVDHLRFAAVGANSPLFVLLENPTVGVQGEPYEIEIGKLGRVCHLDPSDVTAVLDCLAGVIYFDEAPELPTKSACRAACDIGSALGLRSCFLETPAILNMAMPTEGSNADLIEGLLWIEDGRRHQFRTRFYTIVNSLAKSIWEKNDPDMQKMLPSDLFSMIQSTAVDFGRKSSKRKLEDITSALVTHVKTFRYAGGNSELRKILASCV